jgi:small subunit ribosomal protein S3
MGHKVHPTGFRLGVIRDWDAKWYADKHYMEYLQEDIKLREVVESMYPEAGVSSVEIDRQANNVTMTIHTARPGILIGRGGQRVDELRAKLEELVGKRIQLNIREVPQPELDAYLVARNVADQIERRLAYRRTLKQAILRSMQAGAKGMRISCAGRLDGAEIARRVTMHEGQVPLHTLRADIDYGFTEAHTTMGRIGVKVWLYRGDVLPARKGAEEEVIAEAMMPPAAPSEEEAAVEVTVSMPEVPSPAEEVVAEPVVEVTAEVETAVEEEKPAAKRRTRKAAPKAKAEAEVTAEVEPTVEEEKPAAKRRTRKAAPKAKAEAEVTAEVEPAVEEEKPAAKRRTRKAAPKAKAEAEVTAEVEPTVEEEKPAAKRRTRKAAPKAKAEAEVTAEVEPAAEPEDKPAENQGDSDAAT